MSSGFGVGTQISELITVAIEVKQIYGLFFDQHNRADQQLLYLKSSLDFFCDRLQQYKSILDGSGQAGVALGDLDSCKDVVLQCKAFLDEYSAVVKERNRLHGKSIVQTILFTTERNNIQNLRNLLQECGLKLLLHAFLTMQQTASRTGSVPPLQTDPTASSQQDVPTEMFPLWTGIQQVQQQLLASTLEQPLIRLRNVTEALSSLKDIILTYGPRLGVSKNRLLDLFQADGAGSGGISVQSVSSWNSFPQGERTPLVVCNAIVVPGRGAEKPVPIPQPYRYGIEQNAFGRVIYWCNDDETVYWKHELPLHTYPFTNHPCYKRPLRVTFLERHDIYMPGYPKQNLMPEYIFKSEEESHLFQSLVRSRELLNVFDVEYISSSKGNLCSCQQLKIWRRSRTNTEPTISFFSDVDDDGGERPLHYEFESEDSRRERAGGRVRSSNWRLMCEKRRRVRTFLGGALRSIGGSNPYPESSQGSFRAVPLFRRSKDRVRHRRQNVSISLTPQWPPWSIGQWNI
ncbi:hypothetical protein K402DRAFT_11412 [Aulographum hederae CBS 113979]|uniref:Uncharacterized protein n=1 Tax=Aulographum hederae CBS 113979 TaxID=1176131 RepID=A0A6G1H6T7_9PEZI|nr:hypothetical protein K402DRAFT_11412 [Aulographum hederae CBS 113979]